MTVFLIGSGMDPAESQRRRAAGESGTPGNNDTPRLEKNTAFFSRFHPIKSCRVPPVDQAWTHRHTGNTGATAHTESYKKERESTGNPLPASLLQSPIPGKRRPVPLLLILKNSPGRRPQSGIPGCRHSRHRRAVQDTITSPDYGSIRIGLSCRGFNPGGDGCSYRPARSPCR